MYESIALENANYLNSAFIKYNIINLKKNFFFVWYPYNAVNFHFQKVSNS